MNKLKYINFVATRCEGPGLALGPGAAPGPGQAHRYCCSSPSGPRAAWEPGGLTVLHESLSFSPPENREAGS